MPTTAYSKYFRRELDVEQLAQLLGAPLNVAGSEPEIDARWREWIRSDIQCSSCGISGAQVVRSAKTRETLKAIRQSHFRFVAQSGGDAHHPFCEFYGADGAVRQAENLVDFGTARTPETRLVRELVCRAIERTIFAQADIRAMRQWFFDQKIGNRFRVTIPPDAIDWIRHLQLHPSYRRWAFHAVHAELPGFDWKQAAVDQFTEENLTLFDLARVPCDASALVKARDLVVKYKDQEVFDVMALRPNYEAAISLSSFIARNAGVKFGRFRPEEYRFRGAPTYLLALCALLLFVSGWEMNVAIDKFGKILNAAPASDSSLGNVIGLNPFHDYEAWRTVAAAIDLAARSANGFDYPAQLAAMEARLREQHRLWKSANS